MWRSCDVPGTVKENIWLMPRLWLHTLIKNIVNKLVLLNHCVTTRHVGNDPTFLPKYWWDVSSRYICSNMGWYICLTHLGCFRPAIVFVVQSDSRSPEPPPGTQNTARLSNCWVASSDSFFYFLVSVQPEQTRSVLGGWCSAPSGLINTWQWRAGNLRVYTV